jgi:hypothetical protein
MLLPAFLRLAQIVACCQHSAVLFVTHTRLDRRCSRLPGARQQLIGLLMPMRAARLAGCVTARGRHSGAVPDVGAGLDDERRAVELPRREGQFNLAVTRRLDKP